MRHRAASSLQEQVAGEIDPAFPELAIGQRVRLRGAGPAVRLRARTGTVVRRDETDAHYVVRLDRAARYRRADGTDEALPEIVVASDNVEVVD